jgi:hypothetical protein
VHGIYRVRVTSSFPLMQRIILSMFLVLLSNPWKSSTVNVKADRHVFMPTQHAKVTNGLCVTNVYCCKYKVSSCTEKLSSASSCHTFRYHHSDY